ncbi:NUDIX hydrolase [Patescibacteria group bacterium]
MNSQKMVECLTLYGTKKMVPESKLVFRPAVYGAIVDSDKILLMKTKSTGKHWFPGGGLNVGEKLEDALIREVTEETGIRIEISSLLDIDDVLFYYEPLDEAYHNMSFFYMCTPFSTVLIKDEDMDPSEESEKPRWIKIDSIKDYDMQVGTFDVLQKVIEAGNQNPIIPKSLI